MQCSNYFFTKKTPQNRNEKNYYLIHEFERGEEEEDKGGIDVCRVLCLVTQSRDSEAAKQTKSKNREEDNS